MLTEDRAYYDYEMGVFVTPIEQPGGSTAYLLEPKDRIPDSTSDENGYYPGHPFYSGFYRQNIEDAKLEGELEKSLKKLIKKGISIVKKEIDKDFFETMK